MLPAGLLTERVTLQARATGIDGVGQANGAWVDQFTVWAARKPVRGAEYFAASQMQETVDEVFTIRYREGVLSTMRLVWNGQPYEIVSPPIDVNNRHEDLELMCVQGIRDGR